MFVIFISIIVVFIVHLCFYVTFFIKLNRQKNNLHLSAILNQKIEEYGGLNLLRQDPKLWSQLGKELPPGDLRKYWVLANLSYVFAIFWFLLGAVGAILFNFFVV